MNKDKKHKAQKQQQSEWVNLNFQKMVENSPMLICCFDEKGIITYVNQSYLKFFGKSKSEILGKKFVSKILKEDKPIIKKIFSSLSLGRESVTIEYRVKTNKNEIKWTEWTNSVLNKTKDGTIEFLSVGQDISFRKRIEQQLNQTQESFKAIVQDLAEGITIHKIDGTVVYESPSISRMFGYQPGFLVGKNPFEFIHPDDIEIVKSEFSKVAVKNNDGSPTAFRMRKQDGSYIHIETLGNNALEDSRINGIIITTRDITERIKAERVKNEIEKRFRLVWENSIDGMRLTDRDGKIIDVNNAYCKMVSKQKDELLGKFFTILHQSYESEEILNRYRRRFDVPRVERKYEREVALWNNTNVWFDVSESFFESGNDLYMLTIFRDITAKKETETEMKIKSEQINKFFDVSLDMLCIADTYGYFRQLNPEWKNTLGYEISELVGKQFFDFIHPDDIEPTANAVKTLSEQKEILNFVNRYRCKDGTYKWIEWKSYPSGNIIYAAARDITERKKTEEELNLNLEQQKLVLNSLPLVHYKTTVDVEQRTIWINDQIVKITGYNPEDFYSDPFFWENRLHPDDKERVIGAYKNIFNSEYITIEYRWLCKDGIYHWFSDRAILIKDENGNPSSIIGMYLNIDERKKNEIDLKNSEERYKTLVSQSSEGISLMELDVPLSLDLPPYEQAKYYIEHASLVECNDAFAKMYGYEKREELIGKKLTDFWVGNLEEQIDALLPWANKKFELQNEITIEKDNLGNKIYFLNNTIGIIENNKLLRVWGIQVDITNQIKINQALQDSEYKFRSFVKQSTEGFILSDEEGKIIEHNLALEKISGFKREEVIGKYYWDYINEFIFGERKTKEKYEQIKNRLTKILKDGPDENLPYEYEVEIKLQDMTTKYIRLKVFTISTDDGYRLASIVTDVTQARKDQRALQESEKRFRELAESLPQIIFEADLKGKLTYVNSLAFEVFGYEEEDFEKGLTAFDMIAPEELDKAKINFANLIKLGKSKTEYIGIRKNGQRFPFQITSVTIEETGILKGIRGTIIDLSENKKIEKQKELDKIRLEALINLGRINSTSTVTELTDYALEKAVEITESKIGYLAFLNDSEDVLTMYSWSRHALKECDISNKQIIYPLVSTGLWGEAVRQRRIMITNNYDEENEFKKGLPVGHVKILRHLNVPVFDGNKIVMLAGVGNKVDEYSNVDADQLLSLMEGLWQIIKRKKAEIQLKEEENKFRIVIEQSIDGYALSDEEGKIIEWNKAAEQISGLTRDEVLNKKIWEVRFSLTPIEKQSEEYHSFLMQNVKQFLQSGTGEYLNKPIVFEIIRPNGKKATIQQVIYTIKTNSGFRVVSTMKDISEQVKLEEELRRKTEDKFKFQSALLSLAKESENNFTNIIQKILEVASQTLNINRASFWRLNEEYSELILGDLYIRDSDSHVTGTKLNANDYPVYFKELIENGIIIANNARENEKTKEFCDGYLIPNNIYSMMDIPVWLEGKIVGVICHETVGFVKEWTSEEESFCISLAEMITHALLIQEKQKVEKEVTKLSRAVSQSPIIIVITDIDGKIEYVNPKFIELTGYSLNEVIGRNPRILKSGNLSEELYKTLWETILSGNEWRGEFCNKKKNGELFWTLAFISPIKNDKGEIINFIALQEDITLRKEMELDLKNALDKAEEASKLKSTLLANMSHELRTPMNGIIGFANILKEDLQNIVHKQMLDKILKSSGRLMSTLNSILNLSELESGTTFISPIELNLSTYIPYYLIGYEKVASEKNLSFSIKILDNHIYSLADEHLLKTILLSLIDNAIKFTEKGSVEIEITSEKHDNNLFAVINVIDTGIGISEQDLEIIFHEFRQVSEGFRRRYEGSGLGLSVARKMARLMKGDIRVKSKLSEGSTFSLLLPGYWGDIQDITDNITEISVEDSQKDSEKKLPVLLLVEDNQQNQEVIEIFLNGFCEVDKAEDGSTAIQLCKSKRYDAILLDINLGVGVDGITTIRELRKIQDYYNIPIIAITGYALSADKQKFLNEGFTDYLAKPFERKDLRKMLTKYLIEKHK